METLNILGNFSPDSASVAGVKRVTFEIEILSAV